MFNGGHAIRDVLINICPLDLHTQKIKALSQMAVSDKTSHFDNIRQKNGLRSEFSAYSVASSKLDDATISVLETLGFK
jgi:hypothetical protein